MRLRFFALIAIAIFFTTIFVGIAFTNYLEDERLHLIDSQIRESAIVLVNSELATLKQIDFEQADEIISFELGPNRIGKFFILRNSKDEVIFESTGASIINKEIPRKPQWVTLEDKKYFIRALNLDLPNIADRTLQVGVLLDRQLMGWTAINKSTYIYTFGIAIVIILISFILTYFLLNPFRQLVAHIHKVSSELKNMKDAQPIPESIVNETKKSWFKSDEFTLLIQALQGMIDRINNNNRLSRVWSARMAHEFKTPLAIVRANLESGHNDVSELKKKILGEVEHLSETVSDFLSWAELETSARKGELHALRVSDVVTSIVERMTPLGAAERIVIDKHANFTAVIFPTHLDQLLTNLIANALKFSPKDEKVEIIIEDSVLKIVDKGQGISDDVLARMGQPFNLGNVTERKRESTGLGLAIVTSIARLYEIQLDYKKTAGNSIWTLKFPSV